MTPSERGALVSSIVVGVQTAVAALLGLTLAHLARRFRRRYASVWAAGWAALAVGLASVTASIATGIRAWWVLYLMAEWSFVVLIVLGCREMALGRRAQRRVLLVAALVACVAAPALVWMPPTFNALFSAQAALMALGFAAAFVVLGATEAERRSGGWKLMRAALAALALLFAAYVPAYHRMANERAATLLSYSSLLDLLLEMLLGFGMLLLLASEARRDLELDMQERRKVEAHLVQSERLASVGTLAAGVAHEINNPLTYVLGNLEQLAAALGPALAPDSRDELAAALDGARHGVERVRRVVRDLQTFSRADDERRGPTDVRAVLRSSIGIVANQIRDRARLGRPRAAP